MGNRMELNKHDIITAIRNQRNSAQDECAQLFAMLAEKDREIAKRDAEIATLKAEQPAP